MATIRDVIKTPQGQFYLREPEGNYSALDPNNNPIGNLRAMEGNIATMDFGPAGMPASMLKQAAPAPITDTTRQPREADILRESETQSEKARIQEREDALGYLNSVLADIDYRTAQRVAQQQLEGVGEEARARSTSIRSGLAGSPFGETLRQEVRGKTREAVRVKQEAGELEKSKARKQTQLSLTDIENRANEKLLGIKIQRAGLIEKQETEALANLKGIAGAGQMSWDDIKRNPVLLQQIKEQTGKDEQGLELYFKSNLSKKDIEFKMEKVGDKMFVWEIDKTTGQVKRRSDMDVSAPEATEGGYKPFQADDGTLFWYPEKFDKSKSFQEQLIVGGKYGKPKDPKIIEDFRTALVDRKKLVESGSREQFIRQLTAQFPQIDPQSIQEYVYGTYPNFSVQF